MERLHTSTIARALLRGIFGLALLLQAAGAALPAEAQTAHVAVTATLTGGAGALTIGSNVFAQSGASLSLTVTTNPATACVVVSIGDQQIKQTASQARSSWTIPFKAPTGDAVQDIVATAYIHANCRGLFGTAGVSNLVLDNTPPAVIGTLSPAPNSAGWNNTDVTLTWSALAGLTGLAMGPHPSATTLTTSGVTTMSASATDWLGHIGMGSVKVQVDKDPPSISGARTPAPNANGWNNSDVSVSFSCSDALSGIKSCPSLTTLGGEGANQSVSGTADSVADNHATAHVTGINIDKTPPRISGAATRSANADGWYNDDVTIHWNFADDLSGIDSATVPSDTVISGEGAGVVATASVRDKAGNRGTGYSPAVSIDRTPPSTIATAPPSWNNSNVTVNLVANDALSGVRATHFRVDDGAEQLGTNVVINTDGIHSLKFWSEDRAGNTEPTRSIQVKIDRTPPTITHTQAPPPNANGWNNTDVFLNFLCASGLSGVANCTTSRTVSSEGRGESVIGTVVNGAGSTATDPAMLNIDKTPPGIVGGVTREPNANGWYRADVTVHFTCSDELSGVASCMSDLVMSGEGANQVATSAATDSAGNRASTSVGGINIDKTPPRISGATTRSANADGWYNGDVNVHWTAEDNLSGVDETTMPADSVVTGEGAGLIATASVKDKAGNQGNGRSQAFNIDRTPPTISGSIINDDGSPRTAKASGWFNSAVRIRFACDDALSGVATCPGDVVLNGDGANQHADGEAMDRAGNRARHSLEGLNVDLTPPTIGAHAHTADGKAYTSDTWTNQHVTVSFECSDTTSGVASCPEPVLLVGEGADQSARGTAADVAGNSASTSFDHIHIDKTPPSTNSAEVYGTPDGSDWYTTPPVLSLSGSDDESGVSETYYKLVPHGAPAPDSNSSEGWERYSGPVEVDAHGDWDVYAYSVDRADNHEAPKCVGHLGGSGLEVTKNADPSAPLTGAIVVRADRGVTIRNIQDFYEVHYPGNAAPAGCGLVPGETLTGNPGDHGWFALAGNANGVKLDTYSIGFSGSPTLNPATTGGAAENALLGNETTTTWHYTTQGEVVLPPECVIAGANAPNSMRNVIVITSDLGASLARSESFTPVFQTQDGPPPCTTACPPPPPPPPSPSDTPELDSLTLFGGGLAGFGGYVLTRLRAVRRRRS